MLAEQERQGSTSTQGVSDTPPVNPFLATAAHFSPFWNTVSHSIDPEVRERQHGTAGFSTIRLSDVHATGIIPSLPTLLTRSSDSRTPSLSAVASLSR